MGLDFDIEEIDIVEIVASFIEKLKELGFQKEIVVVIALYTLAKALGIIEEKTQPEEIGGKAIQLENEGVKPENFDTRNEYLNKVENYKLDKEKTVEISEKDKFEKAAEIILFSLLEKNPEFSFDKFAEIMLNPNSLEYLRSDGRMEEFGKIIKNEVETANNIVNYLKGNEHNDLKIESAIKALINIEKNTHGNISREDAMNNILQARI